MAWAWVHFQFLVNYSFNTKSLTSGFSTHFIDAAAGAAAAGDEQNDEDHNPPHCYWANDNITFSAAGQIKNMKQQALEKLFSIF